MTRIALEGPDGVGKTACWEALKWAIPQTHDYPPFVVVERREDGLAAVDGNVVILEPWYPGLFQDRWVFVSESLPGLEADFNFADPISRSWTFCFYRKKYALPAWVDGLAKVVIQDRSYLSNVIYSSDDPRIQDRIEDIEKHLSGEIDHFIVLLGTHAEKPDTFSDVGEIARRYIDWCERNPGRSTIIDTGGMSVSEVVDRILTIVEEHCAGQSLPKVFERSAGC